jgi:hypothetical protein
MGQIPIKQQRLRRDAPQILQHEGALGNEIRDEATPHAVEPSAGTAALANSCELLLECSVPPRKPRRGRPRNHRGREDFVLEQVDKIYPWLLARYQDNKPKADQMPPSERAYRLLAKRARKHLKNIDWTTLRNKHTDWKLGRFHPIENCTDSEDYEADIERQFPPPNGSQ